MASDHRFRSIVLGLLALVIVAGIVVLALPGDSEKIRDSETTPYVSGWAGGVERCAALVVSRRYASNAAYQSTSQDEKSMFAKELARRRDGPPENLVG